MKPETSIFDVSDAGDEARHEEACAVIAAGRVRLEKLALALDGDMARACLDPNLLAKGGHDLLEAGLEGDRVQHWNPCGKCRGWVVPSAGGTYWRSSSRWPSANNAISVQWRAPSNIETKATNRIFVSA